MGKNSPERKEMLALRREKQLNAVPTKELKSRGLYVPAGLNKNTKPENR